MMSEYGKFVGNPVIIKANRVPDNEDVRRLVGLKLFEPFSDRFED